MRWSARLLLFFLAIVLPGCASGGPVLIGQASGVFLLQRARSRVWLPATPTAIIYAGDRVQTGVGEAAELRMQDGSTFRLAPESRVAIARSSNDPNVIVTHSRGAFQLDARSPLTIKTPLITAGIRGTSLRVEVASTERSILATDEGLVQVSQGATQVFVAQGQEVDARAGEALTVQTQQLRAPRLSTPRFTNDGLQVSGLTDPDQRAEVLVDGAHYARVKADISGQFIAPLNLTPGLHELRAVRLGVEGSRSELSEPVAVRVNEEQAGPIPQFASIISVTRSTEGDSTVIIRGRTNIGATLFSGRQEIAVGPEGDFLARIPVPADTTEVVLTVRDRGQTLQLRVPLPP